MSNSFVKFITHVRTRLWDDGEKRFHSGESDVTSWEAILTQCNFIGKAFFVFKYLEMYVGEYEGLNVRIERLGDYEWVDILRTIRGETRKYHQIKYKSPGSSRISQQQSLVTMSKLLQVALRACSPDLHTIPHYLHIHGSSYTPYMLNRLLDMLKTRTIDKFNLSDAEFGTEMFASEHLAVEKDGEWPRPACCWLVCF